MTTAPPMPQFPEIPGPTGIRLEDQLAHYEKKCGKYQKYYKRIKALEIVAAALIPFLAALRVSESHPQWRLALGVGTAVLGVLITVLEGILQLYQFQQIWITYRATCEAMNHEKYLYLAKAGDYAKVTDPLVLLAERIEAIGSQENTKWASLAQQQPKVKTSEPS